MRIGKTPYNVGTAVERGGRGGEEASGRKAGVGGRGKSPRKDRFKELREL